MMKLTMPKILRSKYYPKESSKTINILDLFCGAGGAAMGIKEAIEEIGFKPQIVGIDVEDKSEVYPFKFIKADLTKSMYEQLGFMTWWNLKENTQFVWASPPCQKFLNLHKVRLRKQTKKHKNLIPLTRKIISDIGCDNWCIENVPLSPLKKDIVIAGGNIGIRGLFRKRVFETSWKPYFNDKMRYKGPMLYPIYGKTWNTATGNYRRKLRKDRIERGLTPIPSMKEVQQIFRCEWIKDRQDMNNVVLPDYAKYVLTDFFMSQVRAGDSVGSC